LNAPRNSVISYRYVATCLNQPHGHPQAI